MHKIKPEDVFRLESVTALQVFRMLTILYGERVADDVANEILYNENKHSGRTVIWPRW